MKSLYLLLALALSAAFGFLAAASLPFVAATSLPTLFLAALSAALLVIALWKQLDLLAALGFILLVAAAGLVAWRESQPLFSLSSVCASLVAWDLVSYGLLLRFTATQLDSRLFKRRLLRLGIVLICGWGLGALALRLKLELSFGLLLLLAFLVVLSLSLSMMYLRRRDTRS